MPTYRHADPEAVGMIESLMSEFHPDLVDAGVNVGCLFAYAPTDEEGTPKSPALKLHGYPCAAIVKIVSHKDRVAGLPDAMIYVDGEGWQEWSQERRRSTLSHELTHLQVCRDDGGAVKLDDCSRPKLKMRQHDAEIGIFYEVVERFGEAAIEAAAYKEIHKRFTQMTFPWG